jgi:hypothetical protein
MNHEHQAAVALVQWWAIYARKIAVPEAVLFAIPNAGGYRGGFASNVRRVVAMKAEGVRVGVSDYFLAIPVGALHGMFLELKKGGVGIEKGRPSKEQLGFGSLVQFQGYAFRIAYGALEAEDAIEKYICLLYTSPSPRD